MPIGAIGLRACQPLPSTIEACIRDTRAASMADSILYRSALANAARGRGWPVSWYERDDVMRDAAAALGGADLATRLSELGRAIGPPWQATHKLAAAAALVALQPVSASPTRGRGADTP